MRSMFLTVVAAIALSVPALGQTVPAGFTVTNLAAFTSPTSMAIAPDGRIFVAQQNGLLRIYKPNGTTVTFHTFTGLSTAGERGLIGVAFDPNFAVNQYVYAHVTRATPSPHNEVVRLRAATIGSDVSDGTETVLIAMNNLGATNHNGGAIHFGPDGKLYIGVGENAVPANAQLITNLLGKILRINSDGTIPADNPTSISGIAGTTTGVNRAIWAAGLRNPFTFAFHPVTGRLFINDVGQNAWEEINEGGAGRNYGWSATEGDFSQSSFPNFTRPFFAYSHSEGFAISGGAFYRPPAHSFPPAFFDVYFYADYVSDWIRRIDPVTKAVTAFATGASGIVDMIVDPEGRLVILIRDSSPQLRRISYTAALPPTIITEPAGVAIVSGAPACFTVYAAGNQPLSYQWKRNNVAIADGPGGASAGGGTVSGATSQALTVADARLSDAGVYTVVVSNGAGSDTSVNATLTVSCPADYNGDTSVDDFDLFDFLNDFNANNNAADYNADTSVDDFDLFDFLNDFNSC
ncbi:MAG: PQQ-dependent sugar dehydrogenase [Phycisphaerae bacterium]|nr:PQQ-dependent sugar dehydrogenase [Phycisphaerae bacterium]